eukprot:5290632-Alexandrium_andersonii.AAC.1
MWWLVRVVAHAPEIDVEATLASVPHHARPPKGPRGLVFTQPRAPLWNPELVFAKVDPSPKPEGTKDDVEISVGTCNVLTLEPAERAKHGLYHEETGK